MLAGLAAVVLLALVHTPWFEARVGRWALGRLRPFGIAAQADRVHYNLLTLHARAEGVTLAADSAAGQPFFKARAVVVYPLSPATSRVLVTSVPTYPVWPVRGMLRPLSAG